MLRDSAETLIETASAARSKCSASARARNRSSGRTCIDGVPIPRPCETPLARVEAFVPGFRPDG